MSKSKPLPECWGHRGASSAFPENTLASFEAALRDGAEGIESDVHVSLDDVVIMFHDPALNRTTNGTGLIKDQPWHGSNGMEHLRTIKKPEQAIPTFEQTVALLMRPENQHAKFDVDVKPNNDPTRLFTLMHKIISAYPDWENLLAPRIILGLWHPRFISPAQTVLPYLRRSYIGSNLDTARTYFWDDVDMFSVNFDALTTSAGERFRKDCQVAGKQLMVWTVNDPQCMVEAARWGVDAILTDTPRVWLDIRKTLESDYERITAQYGRAFLWTTWQYYPPFQILRRRIEWSYLNQAAGPFTSVTA